MPPSPKPEEEMTPLLLARNELGALRFRVLLYTNCAMPWGDTWREDRAQADFLANDGDTQVASDLMIAWAECQNPV
jgi:hypothetical protein